MSVSALVFWGNLIQTLRKEARMSQRSLGEVVGIDKSTLRRFEIGQSDISVSVLDKLLRFFGYELEAIKMDSGSGGLGMYGGINLISFGSKHGDLRFAGIIDCTCLRNPYNVDHLKDKTGLDPEVVAYVSEDPSFATIVNRAVMLASPGDTIRAKCIGGKHRSVVVIEAIAAKLIAEGHEVYVTHRDIAS